MRFLISLILCSGLMAQAILTTTTTSAAATSTTGNIQLTSTTGATPGTYAYIIDVNGQPGELVLINSISGSTLTVSRGVGGLQRAHIAGAGVTLGPIAAFKTTFPNGACVATEIVYTPWININTGIKYECTGGAWTATNSGGGGGGGGLPDPGASGIVVRTASGTTAARAMAASANITWVNPDGVAGAPQAVLDTAKVPTFETLQAGAAQYCAPTGGSTSAFTCATSPVTSPVPWVAGSTIRFRPDVAPGAGATLAVSGDTARPLQRQDGTAIQGGDMSATQFYELTYNTTGTTGWRVLGIPAAAGAARTLAEVKSEGVDNMCQTGTSVPHGTGYGFSGWVAIGGTATLELSNGDDEGCSLVLTTAASAGADSRAAPRANGSQLPMFTINSGTWAYERVFRLPATIGGDYFLAMYRKDQAGTNCGESGDGGVAGCIAIVSIGGGAWTFRTCGATFGACSNVASTITPVANRRYSLRITSTAGALTATINEVTPSATGGSITATSTVSATTNIPTITRATVGVRIRVGDTTARSLRVEGAVWIGAVSVGGTSVL